jgi:hypothetical protein
VVAWPPSQQCPATRTVTCWHLVAWCYVGKISLRDDPRPPRMAESAYLCSMGCMS